MKNLLKFPKIENNYINILLKSTRFLLITFGVFSSTFLILDNFFIFYSTLYPLILTIIYYYTICLLILSVILFSICVIILIPLLPFKPTRIFSSVGLIISSYVFTLTFWNTYLFGLFDGIDKDSLLILSVLFIIIIISRTLGIYGIDKKINNLYNNKFYFWLTVISIIIIIISSLGLLLPDLLNYYNADFNKINKSENRTHNEELGYFDSDEFSFVFYYPSYLKVEINEDNPKQLFVYPKINNDPLTAIVITEISNNDLEDSENTEPNENISLTDNNITKEVGNLVLLENWTLIEDTNSEIKVRIGYLIEENKGAKPLIKEFDEIVNAISFK